MYFRVGPGRERFREDLNGHTSAETCTFVSRIMLALGHVRVSRHFSRAIQAERTSGCLVRNSPGLPLLAFDP